MTDWEQLALFDIDETDWPDEDTYRAWAMTSQLNNAETNKDTNKGD